VLIAVAAATHSATLAVLLVLTLAAIVHFLLDRLRRRIVGIWRGQIALMLGTAMVFAANFIVAKRLAWTPGGFAAVVRTRPSRSNSSLPQNQTSASVGSWSL
jgi:hypothetical protein